MKDKTPIKGWQVTVLLVMATITFAVWLITAAVAQAQPKKPDPPRIVPWQCIGNICLGRSEARVVYSYGPGGEYRMHGGALTVMYGRWKQVAYIFTTSRYYRTSDGVGVGARIPLGKCYRVKNKCQYRWRGFVLKHESWRQREWQTWERWWKDKGQCALVQLEVRRGQIIAVTIISPHYGQTSEDLFAYCAKARPWL